MTPGSGAGVAGAGWLRGLMAWMAIVLLVVPIGGALWLGVAHGESPCILCWAQRTSMLLVALVALFVVRYGPRPRYVGLLVLLGAWGTFMALRHSALHLARDVGQGFSGTVLGAHTYVWAWVIHWVVLVAGGLLLMAMRGPLGGVADPSEAAPPARVGRVGRVGRFAMGLFVVLTAANAVQAFVSTGTPPYLGQGDPIRLSFNPSRWVWSTAETGGAPSWRGSWTIPRPEPFASDPDPATGPLEGLPVLEVVDWMRITAPVEGTPTGMALPPGAEPPASGDAPVLVVTDGWGVYVLDATLARVLHRVVLDKGFSIDLTPLAGAAFVGPDTLAVLSDNKSYVLLHPDPAADADREWRHFLETDGTVTELRRSRFITVRARQMYVQALAYDPGAGELVTVSVPSPRHRRMVVSRFDRTDMLLSSEFVLRLGDGVTLAGPERGLGEYVVTGAAVADGLLYAVSAAHSTLLVIDLAARTVTAAYALPDLARPVGLAVRGGELLVMQADGRVAVAPRPVEGLPAR